MPNPDFICIGAQKAGTTWLHHQLNQHPEVWMPPVKELHFFDQQDVSRRIYLLFRKGRRKRTTINQLRRVVRGDEPRWMLTYLFTKRTPSNYTKLFYPQEYQISGECTPAYARLELEAVAKIAQLEPQPKIIYLLRNPVDRAWSQVNFFRKHNSKKGPFTFDEVMQIKEERFWLNSSYVNVLEKWETHFPKDRMFIGFFDQIKTNPDKLLKDLFQFLDINSANDVLAEDRNTPQNKNVYRKISFEEELFITQKVIGELEKLHDLFGNEYTQSWLNRAHMILDQAK